MSNKINVPLAWRKKLAVGLRFASPGLFRVYPTPDDFWDAKIIIPSNEVDDGITEFFVCKLDNGSEFHCYAGIGWISIDAAIEVVDVRAYPGPGSDQRMAWLLYPVLKKSPNAMVLRKDKGEPS
jgi:hypothetical protein